MSGDPDPYDSPERCCDRFDPDNPDWGVGEPDDLAVTVCAHVWHKARTTYDPSDTSGVFIQMIETPGYLTQHVCEDPNCQMADLCSWHWTTFV